MGLRNSPEAELGHEKTAALHYDSDRNARGNRTRLLGRSGRVGASAHGMDQALGNDFYPVAATGRRSVGSRFPDQRNHESERYEASVAHGAQDAGHLSVDDRLCHCHRSGRRQSDPSRRSIPSRENRRVPKPLRTVCFGKGCRSREHARRQSAPIFRGYGSGKRRPFGRRQFGHASDRSAVHRFRHSHGSRRQGKSRPSQKIGRVAQRNHPEDHRIRDEAGTVGRHGADGRPDRRFRRRLRTCCWHWATYALDGRHRIYASSCSSCYLADRPFYDSHQVRLPDYVRAVLPVQMLAFTSCSSAACLPVNIEQMRSAGTPA